MIEFLLESLDEEYGNPDEWSSGTQAMEEAAEGFVRAVVAEYSVWSCDREEATVVDVKKWMAGHAAE